MAAPARRPSGFAPRRGAPASPSLPLAARVGLDRLDHHRPGEPGDGVEPGRAAGSHASPKRTSSPNVCSTPRRISSPPWAPAGTRRPDPPQGSRRRSRTRGSDSRRRSAELAGAARAAEKARAEVREDLGPLPQLGEAGLPKIAGRHRHVGHGGRRPLARCGSSTCRRGRSRARSREERRAGVELVEDPPEVRRALRPDQQAAGPADGTLHGSSRRSRTEPGATPSGAPPAPARAPGT